MDNSALSGQNLRLHGVHLTLVDLQKKKILAVFGLFWKMLAYFGKCWPILENFWPILAELPRFYGILGNLWRQFMTVIEYNKNICLKT